MPVAFSSTEDFLFMADDVTGLFAVIRCRVELCLNHLLTPSWSLDQ